MFKKLLIPTAIVTAFAATPVLAGNQNDANPNDPEWEKKGDRVVNTNRDQNGNNKNDSQNRDGSNKDNGNKQDGTTKTYDEVSHDDKKVTPDRKAYDKENKQNKDDSKNQQHPAHEMGEGDETPYEGQ